MKEKGKFDLKTTVIIIMALLLIVCFAKIKSLSMQSQKIRNDLNYYTNELSLLHSQISSIYDNVDDQLKKEASLISGFDYSFGDLSTDKGEIALNASVVPKLICDDMKLTITVDGNTSELIRNKSSFNGTIGVGLFIDYGQHPLLTIETGNETKTEYLEGIDISNMFSVFLPSVYADIKGSSIHSDGNLSVDSKLSVQCKPSNSDVVFTSFTLIEEIDGQKINCEDITDEVKDSNYIYSTTYKKNFQISENDELKIYVAAEDSLGYVHKMLAYNWYKTRSAAAATVFGGESIYDSSGDLLYGGK